MLREADAVWTDGAYAGSGSVSVSSGVLTRTKYVWGKEENPGSTSAGELLAAAIATSVSGAVAQKIGESGHPATAVSTHAVVSVDYSADAWKIHSVHLDIAAMANDYDQSLVEEAVEAVRRECPIASDLNLDVTLSWKLVPLGTTRAA